MYIGQRKHSWTDEHFTSLYTALDENIVPSNPEKFDKILIRNLMMRLPFLPW
jgi:hypothetical protein